MNETYCSKGKINCLKHKCDSNGECCEKKDILGLSFRYVDIFEVCPWPSKQQKIERYHVREDQLAQIDCHCVSCYWHKDGGGCENISPAIRLKGNPHGADCVWDCFSFKHN
jgi:hypothetical protein